MQVRLYSVFSSRWTVVVLVVVSVAVMISLPGRVMEVRGERATARSVKVVRER